MQEATMSRRRLAVCFAVLCATLAYPEHARAGLGDIIWEMTGPQLVGGIVRCRVPFNGTATQCDVRTLRTNETKEVEKIWFAAEGGVYVSTGHNGGGIPYEAWNIWMLTLEPMFEVRYPSGGDISQAYTRNSGVGAVYGGIGPMINRFLVKGPAEAFTKYGIKVRPIAIAYNGWAVEWNIRVYPDGVTPDQFGFGPPLTINRPFEAVQSISISVPWVKWKFGG
jgi:hypothetical protein